MTGPFVQSDFSPGPDAPPLIQVEAALRTSAGTAVTAHALLTNTADETRVLSVTAHGVDAKWLPRPARSQPLGPGESIGVELAFRPIEGTVAAAYPLAIAVQSLDPTSEAALGPTAIANVTLTVDAPGAIAIHLSPTESTGVFRRSVQVQIENFGVTPASVELETEASAGIRVGLSSHRVDVPAGQKVPVRAHVRPRRRRLVGSRIRYRFNVTGRAGSAPQTAEGSFVSRAMLGSNGIIAALVSLAMVFWIGAVVMLIPKLASSMKHQNTTSANAAATQTMTAPATQPGGAGATSAPSAPATGATGGGSGGSTGSAPGGGTGPSSGGGSNGGSGNAAPASANSLLLSGIVSANAPGGVKVQIAPVSPIDAANSAQTATTTAGYSVTPLGFSATALNDTGKITSDAMNVAAPTSVAQNKTTTTTSDGGWQIAGVAKPGYYLITFSKSGYQTARVIVDSSSAVAAQPINVTLSPGQGTLTGTVRGPNGPVGGATVTITDGVNTVSTSTTSVATAAAAIGSWSMTGLATPSSYLVSATATGLSTESTLVDLTAGGQATVQLTLKSGVTSLQGKIQSRDNSGNLAGLGGATVTATDARGNAQSATAVTKGSVAGNYILPDLAPGAYTLTVAANGYTTQTSKLTITAGQSSVTHSAVLSSAFGAVYGTVVDATGAAQVGAGVVLANATNTYKVTTTSTPVPGAFTFAGVVPGTYTLTTQLFGFGVETVTVTVVAGATKQVAVALEVAASTVAATGHVTGTVVDLSTGIAPDSSIQVTASVDNPNYDASLGANVTCNVPAFTATVDGNRPYTLPDPTTDPDCGLPPGLYTITVSAPDYEAGTVSIPLPLGATVLAPVATLAPAPKLMGAISVTADSAPAGPTCVWAAATGATVDTSALVCLPPSAPNPGCPATLPTGTLCQSVAGGTGDYEMTVPAHGSYQVWIQSSDPEFRTQGTTAAPLALNAASVMLPRASTAQYNAVMNRFGRAQVTVQEASTATGALAPAAGVTIRVQRSCSVTTLVTPAPTFQPPTTGADGVTLASGLNGTYGFAVTSAATGATGCIPVTANLNTTATYVLPVTQAVPYIIGRVVYNMDGQLTPVANATVQLTGVSGFTGTTALTPTSSTWAVTTDADGCFLIHSAGDSTPVNVTDPNCPNLDSEYLASGASNPTVASSTYIGQLANTTLISNLMSSVVVLGNADFNPYPPSAMTMAPDSVTDLVVVPAPLALSSPANAIAVNPAGTFPTGLTDSSGTPITSWPQFWNAVTLQVQPGTASATIDAGSSGTTTFHLATSAGVDRVPAGTYTLRAYFNGSGFQTATIKLICAPLQGCTLRDPATGAASAFEINQQASLKITLNGGGTTVSGAKVSLIYNGSPVTSATTDGSSSATFTRQLVPNDTSYSIGVQAAGFKFIPDNATLSCSGPVLSAGVGPGVTLSCTVNLTKLGTIHGTARSYDVTPPDYLTPGAPIYSGLSNLEVTATRCSGTVQTDATTNLSYCVPSTDVFTATTGSDGSYTLSGTATAEGLVDGDWIVSVTSPYRCAAPSYDPTTPSGCPSPSSAVGSNPLGVAITISGGAITAGDPTINFVHLPAVLTVNAVVFGGGPASPASGVSLQLTSTSDPNILETPTVDSTHDNVFTFNPLPPGTYTVTAIGAGFQTQSFQVTLADGGSTQTIPLAQVSGGIAVTVNAGGAPVADAHVCLVLTKGAGPCVGSPNNPTIITTVLASDIVDTDGHHTGTYVFASAPFMLMPYYVQVDGVYGYENWFGNVPPSIVGGFTQFTAALTPVTRNVELTITATDTNDNIAGAAWTTARLVQVPPDSGPTPPIAANVNLGIPSGSANIATFSAPQLMWGCWRLAYQITGHFGTISMTGGLALTDGTLTCPENSILVSGDTLPTDQPVTGTYGDVAATGTLAEYLASVRVTADDGGSQLATPAYINVTATDNAVPSLTYFDSAVAVAATATELAWVPTGATVNLTVAFQTGTDSHWEILTNSVLTITSSVPTATVNLAVPVSTVTVNVTNAFDPTTGVAATVTLTPPSAYSITPSTSTTANGVCAIDGVFYGDWTLSVTPPTPATSYPSDEITQTVAVSSGTTTVDIQVKPLTKNVTVAVSNSDGITSAGAGVSVTLTAPAGWDAPTGCTSTPVLVGGNWTCTQTTGADGTVTFAGVYYTISSTIPTYTASSGTAPSITFGVRNNAPAPNPKIILSSP